VDRRAATLRFALALALLAPGAAARASEAEAVCANDLERRVLALVNAERAALGRPRLALDVRLNAAARRHAEDLHDGCFLAHTGSDGSSPQMRMAESDYPDGMSEVAATGTWPFPPDWVVDAWMDSPGHRAALTDARARHLGMSYADGSADCPKGFWVGTTGDGPDSEFLDEVCCPTPGGAPACVPEPGAGLRSAAVALALGLAAAARRRLPGTGRPERAA